jgi:hypothetical protein
MHAKHWSETEVGKLGRCGMNGRLKCEGMNWVNLVSCCLHGSSRAGLISRATAVFGGRLR